MSVYKGTAMRHSARRAAAVLAAVVGMLFVCDAAPTRRACAGEGGVPAIRLDHASFWYQRLPHWNDREPWEVQGAPPWSSTRLAEALRDVLQDHALDFPQPPPIDIVVQAPPRAELDTLLGYMANRTSYGGARRVGSTVYVDVNQSAFAGPDRLNDAELRAFVGHELVHAYQHAAGRAKLGNREIFRREVLAYTWELEHLEPEVRSGYRGDIFVNLRMYREMLGD